MFFKKKEVEEEQEVVQEETSNGMPDYNVYIMTKTGIYHSCNDSGICDWVCILPQHYPVLYSDVDRIEISGNPDKTDYSKEKKSADITI